MNKLTISDQIRTLRKSKGLSQENLAENAGINLRTLQRIEAGNAEPRGETLRLLARALDVPIESLSELIEEPQISEEEDLGFLKLMNLSALSFWFIPFGNILIPLGFWIYRKNTLKGVRELGKRILNFQITWSIVTYGAASFIIFAGFTQSFWVNPLTMLPVMLLLYFANTIFIINTNRKIIRGEEDVYSTSLKIIQ
ncbi:helix-turn-helix domain-containing protein [Dyadobacter arcticus]|uniref:Transcriptional regulator with XRE-family HTH domain n=1 Tax=Dyadobacter arcticus TaxID=1078754 RepID=A0ABX0ULG4_9BACT|nr:helix-turn-helix domain-containing protein [Dyadobacter arcticus]NIJ53839.1 transcriptional regulator with XRE-family HTH domain [Dyadobacter arcticus]